MPKVWLEAWQVKLPIISCSASQVLRVAGDAYLGDWRTNTVFVFQGSVQPECLRLLDAPCGIEYLDGDLLAVAAGSSLFVYRSLKPHLKISLPSVAWCTGVYKGSLIVGCDKSIVVFDSALVNISHSLPLSSPPAYIICIDATIVAVLLDGSVRFSKGENWMHGVQRIQGSPAGLANAAGLAIVATKAGNLHAFTSQGVELWTMQGYQDQLVGITTVKKNYFLLGLRRGELVLFNGRKRVHTFHLDEGLLYFSCGPFGREPDVLLTVCGDKISCRVLSRGFEKGFDGSSTPELPSLDIARKTKIFVETVQREKKNPLGIADMIENLRWNFKLKAVQEMAEMKKIGAIANTVRVLPQVSVKVIGMGPDFRLVVRLKTEQDIEEPFLITVDCSDEFTSAYRMHSDPICIEKMWSSREEETLLDVELLELEIDVGPPLLLLIKDLAGTTFRKILVTMPSSEPPLEFE